MELTQALRLPSTEISLLSPISQTPNHQIPIIPRPSIRPKLTFSGPKTKLLRVMAKKKSAIEGVSEELNLIASQNLDQAPARRRVRSAFTEIQQNLDHCLFKVGFFFFFFNFRP